MGWGGVSAAAPERSSALTPRGPFCLCGECRSVREREEWGGRGRSGEGEEWGVAEGSRSMMEVGEASKQLSEQRCHVSASASLAAQEVHGTSIPLRSCALHNSHRLGEAH